MTGLVCPEILRDFNLQSLSQGKAIARLKCFHYLYTTVEMKVK